MATFRISTRIRDYINQKLNNKSLNGNIGTQLYQLQSGDGTVLEPLAGTVNTHYLAIDDCEALNVDTMSTDTVWKATASTAWFKRGTKSLKLESLTTAAVGDTAYNVITETSWNGADKFGFWALSNITLSAGDVKFYIKDTDDGEVTIDLPALTGGVPKWCELSKGALTPSKVTRYGFQRNKAAKFVLYIDQITGYLATETTTLSQVPLETAAGTASSLKTMYQAAAETSPNTFVSWTEGTDYIVAADAKRVIWVTDQHLNTGFVMYKY